MVLVLAQGVIIAFMALRAEKHVPLDVIDSIFERAEVIVKATPGTWDDAILSELKQLARALGPMQSRIIQTIPPDPIEDETPLPER